MQFKYIVFDSYLGGELVLFPDHLSHDAVALLWLHTMGRVNELVLSAGFVSKSGQCYGKSHGLNVKSRPEDTALLKKYMTDY